jgi:hypothetical protein
MLQHVGAMQRVVLHAIATRRCRYALVELPAACATTAACANGGEFDSSCKCKCAATALWSGAQCDQCTATCLNGGQATAASPAAVHCRRLHK